MMKQAMQTLVAGLMIWSSTLPGVAQEEAEFTEPGWFQPGLQTGIEPLLQSGPAVADPGETNTFTALARLVGAPEIAEAITPEIEALARGLENDPKKIFDYVHDHIRYVHYFGSKKGAQLTLLERSGNDFDQCALLVALLRAAGHAAAYRFGTVSMPYEQTDHRDFKHWVGLTKANTNWGETLPFVAQLNGYRGFPLTGNYSGDTNTLLFHRVWVRLTWNSTVYSLDPAFKTSEPVAGLTNLNAVMGLDTNQLLTAAGGTSTSDYVQSLSEVNLRNKLRDYTTNLLTYLQSNQPNATVADILSGRATVSSAGQPLNQGLPFTPVLLASTSPAQNWNYIPTNLMTTLNVTVDGTNQFFWLPQLQGQKLSLTFSNSGLAQLWLEDELLVQKQTGGGTKVNVVLKVDHPHGLWDLANNVLVNTNWHDHVVTNTYQRTSASYAIVYAFEAHADWLRSRQNRLDRYREQGLADTSREVVTETLNVMGLNWMLQTERLDGLLGVQEEILIQNHHRLGRMAQESSLGYYIDVYQQVSSLYPASGLNPSDQDRWGRVFDLGTYFSSAAEHGVIEQLQAGGIVAASTIKMLQIANTNGQRTYLANSANWSAIQGSLVNYTDLAFLKANYIDYGYALLMPANGGNVLAGAGSWKGYGLVARYADTNGTKATAMLISGGYNGGYASIPTAVVDTPKVAQSGSAEPDYFDLAPALVGSPMGADPVSMADGAFHLSAVDLSLGQAEPRGISLSRHYSSSRRLHNSTGLARGWVHNYLVRATDTSAPLAGLGLTRFDGHLGRRGARVV